ncbi:hypothetical protein AALB16_09015 [Lachnospiraceae bacterium 62-35]
MKRTAIEYHLKSAVRSLTPDVLSRIDLTVPQDNAPLWLEQDGGRKENLVSFGRRFRMWGAAAAASICIVMAGSSGYHVYLNQKTDSIIGIDVNPSVELSINRKNKVLRAIPLNEDAKLIMEGIDLEGVDLDIAVNAIIGLMVTHGYLDDLDNAILVTVTNDSISKADVLRQEIVEDIEQSLKENEVQAIVYDQQVVEKDEVKQLAGEYGISYGKAYFLHELIGQNSSLTPEDMEELSNMTMEQIAAKIADSSYTLGERAQKKESLTAVTTEERTENTSSEEETASSEETTEESAVSTTAPSETATEAVTTEPETKVEEEAENRLKIDFADYEDGMLIVYFTSNVKWKDETVSIRGENGESYAAMIEETYSDSCEISIKGLEGGKTYRFSIGGVRQKQDGKPMSVSGTFETPMISEEATESETTAEETTKEETSDVENGMGNDSSKAEKEETVGSTNIAEEAPGAKEELPEKDSHEEEIPSEDGSHEEEAEEENIIHGDEARSNESPDAA